MKEVIGLDLGGTYIKVGLVDEKGDIIKKDQIPTKTEEGKKESVLHQMEIAISSVWKTGTSGIGIGTPGVVDNQGMVFEAPNLPQWDNLPLKKIFEEKFNIPVVVENDVNSITWGEYLFGAGKGCDTIICLTLGTGVGGGMVIHKKLFRGAKYSAAELGHISIDYRGPKCKCGSIGCIERFVGRDYIIERAVKEIQNGKTTLIYELAGNKIENITPKIISNAYKQGDKIAENIWIDVGICLGAMLAGLVNTINPDRIVIGGGISHAGEILFQTIKQTIKERAFKILSQNIEVVPAGLSTDAGIISGAALVFQS